MDNIIDFFSRKSYKDIITADYQMNDELTNKHRVYIGCLKPQDTKAGRNIIGEYNLNANRLTT